ncbi:ubiquitin carboxyl-terminal hydrolase 19 [Elysia marginata]|uniref:ubiquitinyl hydrolase 1 n=1 Tax=Elysia marginata TaxID=1093978 RepID=A0AAV4JDP7_9GAST|nr:ubiquitin carboxyl-terminal hydrolase 19 [Elysia marginata]
MCFCVIRCEVLSEDVAGEDVLEIPVMQRTLFPSEYPTNCAFCRKTCLDGPPLRRCTKCYKVGYCDQTCQRNHWNLHKSVCSTLPDPIGCPFIMSVPASRATFSYLVKHMEEFARFSVDIFQPPVKSTSSSSSATSSSSSTATPDIIHAPGVPSSSTFIKSHTSSPAGGAGGAPSSSLSSTSVLSGGSSVTGLGPTTNLSSCSLSQSSSSLNSLDSLSSASSTCTLTGDTSDTTTGGGGGRGGDVADGAEDGAAASEASASPRYASPCPPQLLPQAAGYDSAGSVSGLDVNRSGSVDSGFESSGARSLSEKAVPVTSVLGVQATDVERDRGTPTFFIKPVSMEGVGIKGADRLEDKGDTPLELTTGRFLSMDWRNNERLESYVLVQSKDLECHEVDNLNNFSTAAGSRSNIYDCLEMFTEPEVLSPEEAWYCPSCKKHVEASKQMSIWRLPHTLVIQLKRFSFQNFLLRSKIKKFIDFPIRGLDLSKFCVGLQPGDSPPIYDLYAVANHHGLLIGGHYTCYVRCSGTGREVGARDEIGWRLCNDSRVSPVACERSVVTPDAYLLFYRRRCPAIIGPSAGLAYAGVPSFTGSWSQAGTAASASSTACYVETLQRTGKPASKSRGWGNNGRELDEDKDKDDDDEADDSGDDDDDDDDDDEGSQGLSLRIPSALHQDPTRSSLLRQQNTGVGRDDVHLACSSHHDIDLKQVVDPATSALSSSPSYNPPPQDINLSHRTSAQQQGRQLGSTVSSATAATAAERTDLEDSGEKKDEEKQFYDCDRPTGGPGCFGVGLEDGIEDDDGDEEDYERNLVIATEPELDYTDMEAVD